MKYTLIELINELHNNYEPKEEYEKNIVNKFNNILKNEKDENKIYINFMNRKNRAKKESLNIVFNNDKNNYENNIKTALNENVRSRTTGYYIILSDFDKRKFKLQLGQGMDFYTKSKEIFIDGYKGLNATDAISRDIKNKIQEMEEYLFENAKAYAIGKEYNKNFIQEIKDSKLISYLDYNISNENLTSQIDILERIIACYPEAMQKYINKENLNELKNYYEKIFRFIYNHNYLDKSGGIFTIFNWMYMDNEIGIKWVLKEELNNYIKSNNSNNIEPIEQEHSQKLNLFFEDIKGRNVIYHGIPGSGKSYFINHYILDGFKDTNYERIVFYPEYSHSDFVGTYKLKRNPETKEIDMAPVAGPFTRILMKARKNTNEQYVLIIEEMNRGNAEAIFGDIFQILDKEDETYIINNDFIIDCINEENKKNAESIYDSNKQISVETKIELPSNLTIIATINTSDQNVFNLDTAFGRRWDYVQVTDNFLKDNNIVTDEVKKFDNYNIKGFNTKWEYFRKAVNEAILNSNNIWNKEDKRLGKFYISSSMLCSNENTEFFENSRENIKIREKFLNKVMRYLWSDIFKIDHSELIEDERINSLEKLIEKLREDPNSLNNLLRPLKEYNKENNLF